MKLSVHAIPHQSRPVGARQLPPGGSQGGLYEFALDFIKLQVPTAKPLSQAPWACQLPFQGRFSRCPLWGKCRAAAKGVSLVALSCYHSSDNTPSVSLAGSEEPSSLPAPPLGSRVLKEPTRHGTMCSIVPCDHDRGRSTIYHKNFRSILAFFAVFPLYNRWGL